MNLSQILIGGVCLLFAKASFAYEADSLDIQRMRPSYKQIFDSCKANPSTFKQTMYYNAYIEGMTTTVGAAMFSTSALTELKYHHGLTAYVGEFLESETTPLALADCLGPKKHLQFVRNLLISEATGKFVGVAISVVGYKTFGIAAKKIGSSLTFIPATIKRKMLIMTSVVGSTYGLKNLYNEYQEIENGKNSSENGSVKAPDLNAEFKKRTLSTADANIAQLSMLLNNPDITPAEKEQLQTQIDNWKLLKTKIS